MKDVQATTKFRYSPLPGQHLDLEIPKCFARKGGGSQIFRKNASSGEHLSITYHKNRKTGEKIFKEYLRTQIEDESLDPYACRVLLRSFSKEDNGFILIREMQKTILGHVGPEANFDANLIAGFQQGFIEIRAGGAHLFSESHFDWIAILKNLRSYIRSETSGKGSGKGGSHQIRGSSHS